MLLGSSKSFVCPIGLQLLKYLQGKLTLLTFDLKVTSKNCMLAPFFIQVLKKRGRWLVGLTCPCFKVYLKLRDIYPQIEVLLA